MKKYNFKFFFGADLHRAPDTEAQNYVDTEAYEAQNYVEELEQLQNDGWEVINHSSFSSIGEGITTFYTIMLRREKKE